MFSFFISEMELRILSTDGLLIKLSITDGRTLILHHIGILSFFLAAILKNIQNGEWDLINNIIPLTEGP